MAPSSHKLPGGASSGPKVLVLVLLCSGLALYIMVGRQFGSGSCTPCICSCLQQDNELPGCETDPVLKEDFEKSPLDLLSEEVSLHEVVGEDTQQHADIALFEVKKLASQFQKEAEKCNAGMETCEEAREQTLKALEAQRKITETWEQRARNLGWRDKSDQGSIFSRIGLLNS